MFWIEVCIGFVFLYMFVFEEVFVLFEGWFILILGLWKMLGFFYNFCVIGIIFLFVGFWKFRGVFVFLNFFFRDD